MVSRGGKDSVVSQQGPNKYAKANRTSTGILISSLLFITVPSVLVGIVELTGFSIFKLVGPFYSACLLVSGCCNAIIFISSNWDNVRPKPQTSSVFVPKVSTVHSAANSGGAGTWH
ncbi:Protein CBG21847 [Caenorhabditis briggsae]|nr:Protein CBG21847 [Caenorhabditis briggsae]CAP38558.2 Protein CBG21847 [Caenorhabditis briggsae]